MILPTYTAVGTCVPPTAHPLTTPQVPTVDELSIQNTTPDTANVELPVKTALLELQVATEAYEVAVRNGNDTSSTERAIPDLMRQVGDSHPDPAVADQWNAKANEFEQGDAVKRKDMLEELGKGLGILLVSPLVIAGGCIYGVGLLCYGIGTVIAGMGNVLTGGTIKKGSKRRPLWRPRDIISFVRR
jgi:hypothetical protein